jgi:hypothetical protein
MRFFDALGSPQIRDRLLRSRYLPSPGTLGLFVLLLVVGALIAAILRIGEPRKEQPAEVIDVQLISEQLKIMEASKEQIDISELQSRVSLTSGIQWTDIQIYPYQSDESPFVVYHRPHSESFVVGFRSGHVITTRFPPRVKPIRGNCSTTPPGSRMNSRNSWWVEWLITVRV